MRADAYIDSTGTFVIEAQWGLAMDFAEGRALVHQNWPGEGKTSYINTTGEVVWTEP